MPNWCVMVLTDFWYSKSLLWGKNYLKVQHSGLRSFIKVSETLPGGNKSQICHRYFMTNPSPETTAITSNGSHGTVSRYNSPPHVHPPLPQKGNVRKGTADNNRAAGMRHNTADHSICLYNISISQATASYITKTAPY